MTATAAFFDMDRTLLNTSSGKLYLQYLWKTGRIGVREATAVIWWGTLYLLRLVDLPRAMVGMLLKTVDHEEMIIRAETQRWFEEWIAPRIVPRAVERLEWHRMQGHRVVILSAATVYIVAPLAARLSVPDYICTYLEVKDGRLTGRIQEPICYGPGKAVLARRFAAVHGIDLNQSYFYSDGYEDLPMLELVGYPVVVNPDAKLARLAMARGWPVERFY